MTNTDSLVSLEYISKIFICLFILTALGLCFCVGFLSEGYSLIVVLGLLTAVVSLVVEYRLSCSEEDVGFSRASEKQRRKGKI